MLSIVLVVMEEVQVAAHLKDKIEKQLEFVSYDNPDVGYYYDRISEYF